MKKTGKKIGVWGYVAIGAGILVAGVISWNIFRPTPETQVKEENKTGAFGPLKRIFKKINRTSTGTQYGPMSQSDCVMNGHHWTGTNCVYKGTNRQVNYSD